MKVKTIALAATVGAFAVPTAFGATVFTDSGFEDAASFVDDGSGDGKWNPFAGGGTSAIVTDSPRNGASHAQLTMLGANQFAGFFQDIDVNAGDSIVLDLWHFAVNNDPTAIEIRIEWRDSVGDAEVARTANSTPSPGAAYENFSIAHTAPAGADLARVVYAAQSFGGSPTAQVNIDDFTVSGSTVPEPSGAVLLSLGALGFFARRKRN
jgi:hypothetical protein